METVNQEVETVNQENVSGEQTAERTFTQAEVNAMVQERLNRDRAKYADYESLKEKAAKFDKIEEESKSELQKATERADSLQKEIDKLKKANSIREIRTNVSAETGVPESLLTGETEEDCQAQAKAILSFAKPGYPSVKDGGEVRSVGGNARTRDQFAKWFNANTNN